MPRSFPVRYDLSSGPTWIFPESAKKGLWYIAIYFSDNTPYVSKFDGSMWRDSANKPMAVPMRIKEIGEFPKERKSKEDSQ